MKDTENETATPEATPAAAEEGKMSLDEALDAALAKHEGGETETPAAPAEADDAKESPKEPAEKAEKTDEPALSAPAEWSAEEKTDFAELSRKQQEAALRLHKSNREQFTRYQQERSAFQNESSTVRALADSVMPFIKATGKQGKHPYQAIQEAVAIVQEIRENPRLLAALEAARKAPAAGATNGAAEPNPEIASLREEVKSVMSELTTAKTQALRQTMGDTYAAIRAESNGAGKSRFPDLNDTESGIKLSGLVGSTVRSAEFQQAVRARNPNATLRDLVVEAYRWHGGKVDDSTEAPKPAGSPQEHVKRAAKAAASKPGRAPISAGSNPKKYKTLDGAIDAALAELE